MKLIDRFGDLITVLAGLVSGAVGLGAAYFILRWIWAYIEGPLPPGTPADGTWSSLFAFCSPMFFGGPALVAAVTTGEALEYRYRQLRSDWERTGNDDAVRRSVR